jgi:3',5'-cyclic AMP phosphodiesterase CpdA
MMQRTHLNIVENVSKHEWDSTAPFLFVVVADPQLGITGDSENWDEDIRIFHEGIDAINALEPRPRFCAIVGDLAHHHPDCEPDVPNCKSIFERQKIDFKKCIARFRHDIPVFFLPGNHDGNPT